ncbi:MAG: tRNA preQ1(34) S-adenosylmethionine ribosyltransferase-isomerase QueA [Desulfobacterales bacterium]|jgi:S-adenosylmethionine:tRNA ribosyltransferase-isomerase
MYSLSDYHYDLPPDLIAQKPAEQRDSSNLLQLNRRTGALSHHRFNEIGAFLNPGDVLVVNNTAVIPGRLEGKKATGGKVEALITDYAESVKTADQFGNFKCKCLLKASKRPVPGSWLYFPNGLKAKVLDVCNGSHHLKFYVNGDFETLLRKIGQVPLPPYIRRGHGKAASCDDKALYQTVYAGPRGAIAAPTAGLHFTEELLDQLSTDGIKIVPLTLHVGYGTFMPVRAADIRRHHMHAEPFTISAKTAEAINAAKNAGKRVVAVGTTCVRTLEYSVNADGYVAAGSGKCDLFIIPGHVFKIVDAMITNFHLPQSTLLMLVSAFAGREKVLNAYREAIRRNYRFYSYGDSMLIL